MAVAIGLVTGLLMGGSLRNVGAVELRGGVAILVLFFIQAVARGRVFPPLPQLHPFVLSLWVIAASATAILLLANARLPGPAVMAAGILLNVTVVLVNGGMPVTIPRGSAHLIGGALPVMYTLSQPRTMLPWMGDCLLVPAWPNPFLVSPGDVLLGVGAGLFVWWATGPQPRRFLSRWSR